MDWRVDGWLSNVEVRPSPNFGERPEGEKISLLVIHNISLPPEQFGGHWVERFFLNDLDPFAHPYFATISNFQVSAHFYLRRDGRIVQFVGCDKRAWHAGQSACDGRENCNDYSIGIELEGSDTQPFSAIQYEALWFLIDRIRERYPISAIRGHSDIAPGRKTDPGPYFEWCAVRCRYPELDLPIEVAA